MLNKLLNYGNLSELENKINTRLQKKLIFGNKIQLAELNILSVIDTIKNDTEYFKKCDFCQDNFSITKLTKIDSDYVCENCIDNNFGNCESCGDYVFTGNFDYYSIDCDVYCKKCYFEARRELYHNHKILSPLLIKLNDTIDLKKYKDYELIKIDFKINNNLYSIESYAKNYFRLGSWSANSWIDIGNNKDDLLKAIDYNLGNNRSSLTKIFINDIEL